MSQSLKNSICSYLQYLFIAVTVQNGHRLLGSKTINYEIPVLYSEIFFLNMFLQAAVILVLKSSMLLETVLYTINLRWPHKNPINLLFERS